MCGEIMGYDDLREHGSEIAVKAAGKLRQQGKPYESERVFSLAAVSCADLRSGRRGHRVLEEWCMNELYFEMTSYWLRPRCNRTPTRLHPSVRWRELAV